MKFGTLVVTLLTVASIAAPLHVAAAQAPCSMTRAVVDSARDDALSVLTSDRPLVAELRREQNISSESDLSHITAVNDRYICAKMAGTFDHVVPPGVGFAVLRIGPMFYARDPDQRRSTGVFADTSFKVLMRLGAVLPSPRSPNDVRNH